MTFPPKDKNNLILHFLTEEWLLEHWIILLGLDSDPIKTTKRMQKRLKWVQDQLKKIDSEPKN